MTIKIIDADDLGPAGIRLVVDLDADNASPPEQDDGRLMELTWGSYESSRNEGETPAQYRNRIKAETRGIAREAAVRRQAADKPTKVTALIGADIT
jgi:hypothetical protein